MPKELFDYLKEVVEEHNAKRENAYCPTDFSKMVQKAIRAMMEADRKATKVEKPKRSVGVVISPASENSDTGPSTRATKPSRKAG